MPILVLSTAISLAVVPCEAELIFDQHVPSVDGTSANPSNLSANANTLQSADEFDMPAGYKMTGFSWSGYYLPPWPTNVSTIDFTIRLFMDRPRNTRIPDLLPIYSDTTPVTFEQIGAFDSFGVSVPVYRFEVSLAVPLAFFADTRLWFSVLDADTTTSDFYWLRYTPRGGSFMAYRPEEGASWSSYNGSMQFAVFGQPIPELSTLALVAIGCVAIGCRRRRHMLQL